MVLAVASLKGVCVATREVREEVKEMKAVQNIHSVLIVEDETLIRFLLSDYLTECGFQVMEAATADDAIEMLEETRAPVDVVFSDVNMPGKIDGFGLARWLRVHRPDTPVLLASGVSRKACALEQGIPENSFVEKPYDVRVVAEQIQTLARLAH